MGKKHAASNATNNKCWSTIVKQILALGVFFHVGVSMGMWLCSIDSRGANGLHAPRFVVNVPCWLLLKCWHWSGLDLDSFLSPALVLVLVLTCSQPLVALVLSCFWFSLALIMPWIRFKWFWLQHCSNPRSGLDQRARGCEMAVARSLLIWLSLFALSCWLF